MLIVSTNSMEKLLWAVILSSVAHLDVLERSERLVFVTG